MSTERSLKAHLMTPIAASQALLKGKVIAIPTETVYGLAASIQNLEAIAKIFSIKNRPTFNPLICHISDESQLRILTKKISPQAKKLMNHFWPGPLTLVLPKLDSIDGLITGGLENVAIRWPSHPLAQEIIQAAGPIAAPSANLSGRLSPTCVEHVWEQLGDKIDGYVDGGVAHAGLESTVVGWEGEKAVLLRHGAITKEEIEEILGEPLYLTRSETIQSPGQTLSHYAPLKPVYWESPEMQHKKNAALLTLQSKNGDGKYYTVIKTLCEKGNLQTAASRFFQALHELEHAPIDCIVVRPFPMIGLGVAMNDRVHRAVSKI